MMNNRVARSAVIVQSDPAILPAVSVHSVADVRSQGTYVWSAPYVSAACRDNP